MEFLKPKLSIRVYRSETRKALELKAAEGGFSLGLLPNYKLPQEDYFFVSATLPIWCVADGVTMELENYLTFPNPSPAGEAARLFAEAVILEGEKRYLTFQNKDLTALFQFGNQAVAKWNIENNRSRAVSNFWDFDLLGTVAAFAVYKDAAVHWASICDCFIARLAESGAVIFKSPECWPERRRHPSDGFSHDAWKIEFRKKYRNGLDEHGGLNGYGVATGEDAACRYLNTGSFAPLKGESMLIMSDGFERYLDDKNFLTLCARGDQEALAAYALQLAERRAELFGFERTLLVVNFS